MKKEFIYDSRIAAIHTLRCNFKSLAAEGAIIRKESKRAGKLYRLQLDEHRRGAVREEARITHLALAFVRNVPYRMVEWTTRHPIDIERLITKIKKHWRTADKNAIHEWLKKEPPKLMVA